MGLDRPHLFAPGIRRRHARAAGILPLGLGRQSVVPDGIFLRELLGERDGTCVVGSGVGGLDLEEEADVQVDRVVVLIRLAIALGGRGAHVEAPARDVDEAHPTGVLESDRDAHARRLAGLP